MSQLKQSGRANSSVLAVSQTLNRLPTHTGEGHMLYSVHHCPLPGTFRHKLVLQYASVAQSNRYIKLAITVSHSGIGTCAVEQFGNYQFTFFQSTTCERQVGMVVLKHACKSFDTLPIKCVLNLGRLVTALSNRVEVIPGLSYRRPCSFYMLVKP